MKVNLIRSSVWEAAISHRHVGVHLRRTDHLRWTERYAHRMVYRPSNNYDHQVKVDTNEVMV